MTVSKITGRSSYNFGVNIFVEFMEVNKGEVSMNYQVGEELRKQALKARELRDYPKSLALVKESLKNDPMNFNTARDAGKVCYILGDINTSLLCYLSGIFMYIHNECLHRRITGTKEEVYRIIWQDLEHQGALNDHFGRHIGVILVRKLKEDANHYVMPNHLLEVELMNYKKFLEGYAGFDTSQEFDRICMDLFKEIILDTDWPYGNFANLRATQQPVPYFMVNMFKAFNIY